MSESEKITSRSELSDKPVTSSCEHMTLYAKLKIHSVVLNIQVIIVPIQTHAPNTEKWKNKNPPVFICQLLGLLLLNLPLVGQVRLVSHQHDVWILTVGVCL